MTRSYYLTTWIQQVSPESTNMTKPRSCIRCKLDIHVENWCRGRWEREGWLVRFWMKRNEVFCKNMEMVLLPFLCHHSFQVPSKPQKCDTKRVPREVDKSLREIHTSYVGMAIECATSVLYSNYVLHSFISRALMIHQKVTKLLPVGCFGSEFSFTMSTR